MKNHKLLTFEEAVKLIDQNTFLNKTASITIGKCAGLILAEPITASSDLPAFTNSAMDGFAVVSRDLINATKNNPVTLEIIDTIAAGNQSTKFVDCGKCAAIMTGAPLPEGADAVIKVEDIKRNGNFVEFFANIPKNENIRFKGEESKKNETLVPIGAIVTPAGIGLASSLGISKLKVYAPAEIAVIITGDEVLPPGSKIRYGKILDATGPMLKAALSLDNFPVTFFGYAKDDPTELDKTIKAAISKADVVIIAGGASMGEFDFVQDCLEKNGVEKIFWKVAVKPGKPIWFGKLNEKLIFNLPGNPVSILVTYSLYVRFALRRQIGFDFESSGLKKSTAILEETIIKSDPRLEFVRGIVLDNIVIPLKQRGSAMMSGMANANCLINFPQNREKISAGETVDLLTFNH